MDYKSKFPKFKAMTGAIHHPCGTIDDILTNPNCHSRSSGFYSKRRPAPGKHDHSLRRYPGKRPYYEGYRGTETIGRKIG